MIHYAIIALLIVSIALLGYHIKQMKDMASAERFNVPGDTANAAERFARRSNIGTKDANSAERFGMVETMPSHLHTRLNRNTGRLYTGEAFGMRKRLN